MAALIKQFDAFKARIKSDDFECEPDTKEALRLLALLRCVDAGVNARCLPPQGGHLQGADVQRSAI
jgi:hypothetical protein